MIEITLVLVLTTVICLASASTRLIGVVGIALLFLLHPWLCLALLCAGVVALYFLRQHNRS